MHTPTRERLRACQGFLLDMDGTIYVSEQPIPGALDLIETLRRRGIPYLFLTNNSSRRARAYQERLQRLGIDASLEQILTSGDATIEYLLAETPYRSAYVVGTPDLEDEFRAAGLALSHDDPDCVVVGFDTTLTFDKLEHACRLLFAGKPYFATHPDRTCITTRGLIPDIAAIIAACEAVTRRVPHIIGKPHPEIIGSALRRLGSTHEITAMIGDQLDTDMAMAMTNQLCGVLVMTGETTEDKLAAIPMSERMFLRAESVADVAAWLA